MKCLQTAVLQWLNLSRLSSLEAAVTDVQCTCIPFFFPFLLKQGNFLNFIINNKPSSMILYLMIYSVCVCMCIYIYIHKCVQNMFKMFPAMYVLKNKRFKLLNCVWHNILARPTKTWHSLHALVSMETQVWFFQLIGRSFSVHWLWLKLIRTASPRDHSLSHSLLITASVSLTGVTPWHCPPGWEGLPVGTSPYLVCSRSFSNLMKKNKGKKWVMFMIQTLQYKATQT